METKETACSCDSLGKAGRSLALLFKAALRALAEEDAVLAKAFSQGMFTAGEFYRGANQGLAYWVGETELVYAIYKAWIPLVRVRWEAPKPVYPGTAKRADLAVFDDDAATKVKWIFEAKWWNQTGARQKWALDEDIRKLLSSVANEGRFLVAFWWTTSDHLVLDRKDVDDYCREVRIRRLAMVDLVYLDSFSTDWSPDSGKSRMPNGLFAVAVLKVDSVQTLEDG